MNLLLVVDARRLDVEPVPLESSLVDLAASVHILAHQGAIVVVKRHHMRLQVELTIDHERENGLVVIVHRHVARNVVTLRQLRQLDPVLSFAIVHQTVTGLIATNHEDLRVSARPMVSQDTRGPHLPLRHLFDRLR